MSKRYDNVIIFGPTGAVGSAAALEAGRRGAKVWLAMRDPSKTINKELDDKDKYPRVQADLTDPATMTSAIQTSGANAAFIYLAHGPHDGMRSVLSALKAAGVTYIVFLSSFTIKPGQAIRDIQPEELIPFMHAKVEEQLEDLEIDHVALRPGNFAYNGIKIYLDTKSTPYEAYSTNGERLIDCIVPSDIGKVGGAVLVDRPFTSNKEIIYLFGPKMLPVDETWKIASEVSGKEIKVLHPAPEESLKVMIEKGLPEPLAKYLIKWENTDDYGSHFPPGHHEMGWKNIKKYSGHEPTTFSEYIATQDI